VVALVAPDQRDRTHQTAAALDLEWSAGHWIVRGEAVASRWEMPVVTTPHVDDSLEAYGISLETRWRVFPGFYAAARLDRLSFGDAGFPPIRTSWDAPLWRAEAGVGWSPIRSFVLKGAVQYNKRYGGPVRQQTLPLLQAVLWF
jgi:hypothetical protein